MRLRLAAPFTVLALAIAGCGGGQATVEQVPGGPVHLTTPGGAGLAPAATATPSATATATPTATTTGASSTGASTGQTSQQTASSTTSGDSSSSGTEAPATGAATATPPPPGSPTQQFEDFCAQNPGAC
jgi:hypothetical protein